MELTFTKGHITRDFTGDYHVTVIVSKDQESNMEPLNELLNDEKLKTCKIGHYKKKRSLNSNSYAWTLITQIADKLRSSKEEVYLQMLKRYGPSSVISIVEEAAEIFKKSVKYCEEFGQSVLNDKNFVHIKVFMGSSEFDTKQMSIFIDGIVNEATELKIPTMTPSEIEKLKNSWQFNL
jgi:hypothetical protein